MISYDPWPPDKNQPPIAVTNCMIRERCQERVLLGMSKCKQGAYRGGIVSPLASLKVGRDGDFFSVKISHMKILSPVSREMWIKINTPNMFKIHITHNHLKIMEKSNSLPKTLKSILGIIHCVNLKLGGGRDCVTGFGRIGIPKCKCAFVTNQIRQVRYHYVHYLFPANRVDGYDLNSTLQLLQYSLSN